jgi:hypothetical protein
MSLKEELKRLKPDIADSSINTYNQILTGIHKKLNIDEPLTPEFFVKHNKAIIDFCSKLPNIHTRKTKLAALVVITNDDKATNYRELMLKDRDKNIIQQKKQQRNEKQKANWITQKEILEKYQDLEEATKYLWKRTKLNNYEFQLLQDYVILSLYTLIPPRRLDYIYFKINCIDFKKDNYLEKGFLHFNNYKTRNTYQKQVIKIPPKLNNILQKWIKINPYDYLLVTTNGTQLSPSRLTLKIQHILGKKTSVSILRSSYLSEKYAQIPPVAEMDKTAYSMGHGIIEQLNTYIKKE